MTSSRWMRILLTVLTGLFAFLALGSWALASPSGSAPDDDFHMPSIWCAWGDRDGLCEAGDVAEERTVERALAEPHLCFAGDSTESAECARKLSGTVSTSRGNFAGNYPPVFYSVMGAFASPDIDASVITIRLVNAGLAVGAVAALFLLLRPGQRGPLVWGAIVTLVPFGLFILPSVNPSSWAVLAGLTVWLATYGYFAADQRWRRFALGALAVTLGVMGAGARGDSAVYVGFAVFAASVLSFEKTREWLRLAMLPAALALVSVFFFFSASQSTGYANVGVAQAEATAAAGSAAAGAATVSAPAPSALGGMLENLIDLPWLWTGATGTWGLGWFDTPLPKAVWVIMIGLLIALIFWGLQRMNAKKAIVLSLALLALTVIPLYVLYGLSARVGDEVQPRYLLPLILIFVGVALYGFKNDRLGLNRIQTAGVLFGAAFANALALRNTLRRYLTGMDVEGINLNADVEWWWAISLQPMTVWIGGSVAFALALAGVYLYLFPPLVRRGSAIEPASTDAPPLSALATP